MRAIIAAVLLMLGPSALAMADPPVVRVERDESWPGRLRASIDGWEPVRERDLSDLTRRAQIEASLAWYDRVRGDAPRSDDVVELLIAGVDVALGEKGPPFWDTASASVAVLAAAGGNEAFRRSEHAYIRLLALAGASPRHEERHEWADRTLTELRASLEDGPGVQVVRLMRALEFRFAFANAKDGFQSLQKQVLELLVRGSAQTEMDWVQRRALWRFPIESWADSGTEKNRARILAAIDATEGVDPWLEAMCRATAAIRDAWDARGSAFAGRTTDEQFAGFAEHLARARPFAERAYELDPRCPEAADALITISMGDGRGEEALWLARAMAAQIDHAGAFYSYGLAIRPRWGGSLEKLREFAVSCAHPRFADTDIPSHGIGMFDRMQTELDRAGLPEALWADEELLEKVLSMADALSRQTATGANALTPAEAATVAALIECRLRRYDAAAARLRALGDGYAPGQLADLRDFDSDLRSIAYPRAAGAIAEEALRADMADRAGRPELAVPIWRELAGRPGLDDATRSAIVDRAVVSTLRSAAKPGGTPFAPVLEPTFRGLRPLDPGQFSPGDEPGAVRVQADTRNWWRLAIPAALGPGVRVSVDVRPGDFQTFALLFDLGSREGGDAVSGQALVCTRRDGVRASGYVARMPEFSHRTTFLRGPAPPAAPVTVPLRDDGWDRLVLEIGDGSYRGIINGVVVHDGPLAQPSIYGPARDPRVMVGVFNPTPGSAVELRGLRVERMDAEENAAP